MQYKTRVTFNVPALASRWADSTTKIRSCKPPKRMAKKLYHCNSGQIDSECNQTLICYREVYATIRVHEHLQPACHGSWLSEFTFCKRKTTQQDKKECF